MKRIKEEKKLYVGDLLQIDISGAKQIITHVEILQEPRIWAADFLADIWTHDWREEVIDVRFMRGDICYSFLVEIEGRDSIEGLNLTRMLRVSDIEEVQRRSSYRLQYSFDVDVRRRNFDDEFTKCKAFDISETGLGFMVSGETDWQEGDEMVCKFGIRNERYTIPAQIMRRWVWTPGENLSHKIGVKFITDDEILLKQLRRFIFKEQVARLH